MALGPNFESELRVAGVFGLVLGWGADGTGIQIDPAATPAEIDIINAVIAAHNPATPDAKKNALDAIQSLGIVSLLKLLDEVVKIQMEQTSAIRAAGGTISNYQPEIVELWTEFHNRLNELQ